MAAISPNNKIAQLDAFEKLVTPWTDGLHWIVIAYVGMRRNESSRPSLLSAQINLAGVLAREIRENLTEEFASEHVVAGRLFLPIKRSFKKVMALLEVGKISVHGMKLELHKDNQNYSAQYYPFFAPVANEGPRLPGVRLLGKSKWELFQAADLDQNGINWELKASDKPYEHLDELLMSLGLNAQGDLSSIILTANVPAVIRNDSSIGGNKASINCLADRGLCTDDLKVGYKFIRRENVVRGVLVGSELAWSIDGEYQVGHIDLDAGDDARAVQIFLSHKAETLHQWWLVDPSKVLNSHYATYESIDPGLGVLRGYLSGTSKDPGGDFEVGVATLCSILEFSVTQLGKQVQRLQDGVDIIASTQQGHILAIECTVRHLANNGKMTKLIGRVNLLKERLSASNLGYLNVQPILVTSLPRVDVAPDLEEAGKNGISVICKEEIEQLIANAPYQNNPEQMIGDIARWIPSAKSNLVADTNRP